MRSPTGAVVAHAPGAVSMFFVVKAGVFAAGFWSWLVVLLVRGGAVEAQHVVAAAGAIVTTLVGVLLGVRYALQRSAALRHQEMMKMLVDISWHSFADSAGRDGAGPGAAVIPLPSSDRPRR
jgi:hypothetical protein